MMKIRYSIPGSGGIFGTPANNEFRGRRGAGCQSEICLGAMRACTIFAQIRESPNCGDAGRCSPESGPHLST